jgi:hypothetical protein
MAVPAKNILRYYGLAAAILCGIASLALPARAVLAQTSFHAKSITMMVGSAPGGGTDASARSFAHFLGKYLPGTPVVTVQNVPGANGVTALNYFMTRTSPDGLTVFTGANSNVDPTIYRNAKAQYDPKNIRMIGGIGTGGTIMFTSPAAEKRLYDKSMEPIVIGNIGPIPRSGMMMALWSIEYLGWNAKWVAGYPGTNEVMLAFDRGEVDLTSHGSFFLIEDRLKAGKMKIVLQTGSVENGKIVGRQELGDAPIFLALMQGKITDPVAQKAFDYWYAINNMDKWVGLAPGTSGEIVAAYRDAFKKFSVDKEFVDTTNKITDGFTVRGATEIEAHVKTLSDTPPEALAYLADVKRKQGLRIK